MRSIGVIGLGVVGGAVAKGFAERGFKVSTYDKFKSEHSNWQGCLDSEAVFVCVPTPTNQPSGSQDLLPLLDVLGKLKAEKYQGIIVIKCTLNAGTTEGLMKSFELKKIVHNPEFLTAARPYEDFMDQKAVLLGSSNFEAAIEIGEMFVEAQFRNVRLFASATMTEKIKHARNGFLTLKVAWANDQFDDCESLGLDYRLMIAGLLSLGGIDEGHLRVPGPDGERGFGGMCFVKDSLAEFTAAKSRGVTMDTIGAAIAGNKRRRPQEYKK